MSHLNPPPSPEHDPLDQDQPPQVGLDEQQYREALCQLLERIEALPPEERHRLAGVVDATRQRHEQLRQTVGRLQETLDTLRVSMKYLIFDVEATRRENEQLRRMLEQPGE